MAGKRNQERRKKGEGIGEEELEMLYYLNS